MSNTTNDPQREWFRKRKETHPNEDLADRIEAFASTTNKDQQPKYLKAAQVRATVKAVVDADTDPKAATAPLLTPYKWLMEKHGIQQGSTYHQPLITMRQCASWIAEYVQAKIASGDLMVVRTAKLLDGCVCDNCGVCWLSRGIPEAGDHCYCGAKIIEAETK